MFVKSTRFKQVCQLLLSLIVATKMICRLFTLNTSYGYFHYAAEPVSFVNNVYVGFIYRLCELAIFLLLSS